MSKRDIETVCCLAAHFALKSAVNLSGPDGPLAPRCAADAMTLQRLGRRARRNAAKRWIHPANRNTREEIQPYLEECQRIHREAQALLHPYGLGREVIVHRDGLTIPGLPGNTLGGDDSGYGI